MSTLIIDIETVGEQWSDIDEVTRGVLTRWVDTARVTKEERDHLHRDIEEHLGFSPLTGCIVALGVYDLERHKGTVYYTEAESAVDETVGAFAYKPRNETAMLQEFWEGVQCYETVVTFNGRSFDLPFILHRSVACGVVPSVDLLRYRYLTQQNPPYHVDLQDQLTFYGAMSKRPSLHLFCRAYGIKSPKADGIAGDDVAKLFYAGQTRAIAEYNAGDLIATARLYERWRMYLAPPLFRKLPDEIDF